MASVPRLMQKPRSTCRRYGEEARGRRLVEARTRMEEGGMLKGIMTYTSGMHAQAQITRAGAREKERERGRGMLLDR